MYIYIYIYIYSKERTSYFLFVQRTVLSQTFPTRCRIPLTPPIPTFYVCACGTATAVLSMYRQLLLLSAYADRYCCSALAPTATAV